MNLWKKSTTTIGIQTENFLEPITETRIENAIDAEACNQRFQEFTEKRNERIYKKIKFNIRNYIILTQKEINEIRLLDDMQKMDIIIHINTAIKYLLELI